MRMSLLIGRSVLGFLVALLVPMTGLAEPTGVQTRTYQVTVDGKPAGQVQWTIESYKDGTRVFKTQSKIQIRILLIRYQYSYKGEEIWKAGRLLRFRSNCNSNGLKRTVTAVADRQYLRVRTGGSERKVRPDVWLSSYWEIPAPARRNLPLAVLDTDTGKDLPTVRLHYVGTEPRSFAGRRMNVYHYRIVGKKVIDVWYDASGRLVRQERVEQGHRTIVEMTAWK